MKTKQKNICHACRRGKISCDAKKPSCSQCSFKGIECPGYPADWVFIPHNARKAKTRHPVARREPPGPKEARREGNSGPSSTSAVISLRDLMLTIASSYVPEPEPIACANSVEPSPRICGSWVEVLPDLVDNDTNTALASAIKAFAVAILSRGPKPSTPEKAALEAYTEALASVNSALRSSYDSFPVEIAAAVMCLLLAELFVPTRLDSWVAHLQGLGGLMELSRPEFYISGIPHRLFIGARPSLIVLSFLSRKSSFLARKEWTTIPFRETPPSPVHELMSEAAVIPSILEMLDTNSRDDLIQKALEEFEAVLARLDLWGDAFLSRASSPLFWFKPPKNGGRQHIWYQNITAANALTHLWAFRIICLRNIDRLRAGAAPGYSPEPMSLEETKRLAVMICQSTEYLLQDKMRLFGPTSVILPLRIALDTFEAGGIRSKEELDWCNAMIADIFDRGYQFIALFFNVESGKRGVGSAG
ncbi:hypothetical protein VTK26DRAFT_1803 [Humicola hyalothermophila]